MTLLLADIEINKIVHGDNYCHIELIIDSYSNKYVRLRLKLMEKILTLCVWLKLFPVNVSFIVKEQTGGEGASNHKYLCA